MDWHKLTKVWLDTNLSTTLIRKFAKSQIISNWKWGWFEGFIFDYLINYKPYKGFKDKLKQGDLIKKTTMMLFILIIFYIYLSIVVFMFIP